MKINKANLSVSAVKSTERSGNLHGIRFEKGGTIGCNGFSLAYVTYPNQNEEAERLEPFTIVFDGRYKKDDNINLDVQHTNENSTAKFVVNNCKSTNEFTVEKLPANYGSGYPITRVIEDGKRDITEKEHVPIILDATLLQKMLEVAKEVDREVTFYIPKEYTAVKMIAENCEQGQEFFGLIMPIKK